MSEENNQEEQDKTQDPQEGSADNTEKKSESTSQNIEQEAKSTVNEIKESWNEATSSGENKKLLAGLLGIFVGGFGVHKFILGYNKEGFILLGTLLLSFVLMCVFIGFLTMYIPILIGVIEGIIYLTKSDEEFYQTYQVGKKPWF